MLRRRNESFAKQVLQWTRNIQGDQKILEKRSGERNGSNGLQIELEEDGRRQLGGQEWSVALSPVSSHNFTKHVIRY